MTPPKSNRSRVGPDGARLAAPANASRIVSHFRHRWQKGEPADAQAVLSTYAGLDWRRSLKMDLIYEEYSQRRAVGESVDVGEFCERFPSFKRSLGRQIEVHRYLESFPGLQELGQSIEWPEVGQQLFEFSIIEELGSGAFARVFLCAQSGVGDRQVVLKVAFRGAHEAETLGRLSHPNIMPIYSVQQDSETELSGICMPFRGRATLCDTIDVLFADKKVPRQAREFYEAAKRTALNGDAYDNEAAARATQSRGTQSRGTYVDGLIHVGVQLGQALQHAHQQGVCHGDLKPSNVLITPHGTPLLLDFNLSRDRQTVSNISGGTLPYMAPEQVRSMILDPTSDEQCDERSDIYSLGVILFEALCGEHPFGEIPAQWDVKQAADELLERQRTGAGNLRKANRQVDRRLATVIGRCLKFSPGDRFASMDQVVEELAGCGSPQRRIQRWIAGRRKLAVALAVALAAAGVGLMLYASVAAWTNDPDDMRSIEELKQMSEEDLFQHGCKWLQRGEWPYGQTVFQIAYERNPNEGRYAAGLAFCIAESHNAKAAAPYNQKAIELGFSPAAVHNNLGYGLLEARQPDRALETFRAALQENSDAIAPRLGQARVELKIAREHSIAPSAGIAAVQAVLEREPNVGYAHLLAACLHGYALKLNEHPLDHRDKALRHMKEAVELGSLTQQMVEFDPAFDELRDAAVLEILKGKYDVRKSDSVWIEPMMVPFPTLDVPGHEAS